MLGWKSLLLHIAEATAHEDQDADQDADKLWCLLHLFGYDPAEPLVVVLRRHRFRSPSVRAALQQFHDMIEMSCNYLCPSDVYRFRQSMKRATWDGVLTNPWHAQTAWVPGPAEPDWLGWRQPQRMLARLPTEPHLEWPHIVQPVIENGRRWLLTQYMNLLLWRWKKLHVWTSTEHAVVRPWQKTPHVLHHINHGLFGDRLRIKNAASEGKSDRYLKRVVEQVATLSKTVTQSKSSQNQSQFEPGNALARLLRDVQHLTELAFRRDTQEYLRQFLLVVKGLQPLIESLVAEDEVQDHKADMALLVQDVERAINGLQSTKLKYVYSKNNVVQYLPNQLKTAARRDAMFMVQIIENHVKTRQEDMGKIDAHLFEIDHINLQSRWEAKDCIKKYASVPELPTWPKLRWSSSSEEFDNIQQFFAEQPPLACERVAKILASWEREEAKENRSGLDTLWAYRRDRLPGTKDAARQLRAQTLWLLELGINY